jgi:hypothetical protein
MDEKAMAFLFLWRAAPNQSRACEKPLFSVTKDILARP